MRRPRRSLARRARSGGAPARAAKATTPLSSDDPFALKIPRDQAPSGFGVQSKTIWRCGSWLATRALRRLRVEETMMEIAIHHYDGHVLFTSQDARNVRDAVQEAVSRRVDLGGALLEGADLHGTDLERARFAGARLARASLQNANL